MRIWDKDKRQWINTERKKKPRYPPVNEVSELLPAFMQRAGRLLPREKSILYARISFDSVKPITTIALSVQYEVSRHRIGQIESAACKKLGVTLLRRHAQPDIEGVEVDGKIFETDITLRCLRMALLGDITIDNGSYI